MTATLYGDEADRTWDLGRYRVEVEGTNPAVVQVVDIASGAVVQSRIVPSGVADRFRSLDEWLTHGESLHHGRYGTTSTGYPIDLFVSTDGMSFRQVQTPWISLPFEHQRIEIGVDGDTWLAYDAASMDTSGALTEVWASADGASWERTDTAPDWPPSGPGVNTHTPTGQLTNLQLITSGEGGSRYALEVSPNGETWSTVGQISAGYQALTWWGPGWATVLNRHDGAAIPAVYVSADLEQWQRITIEDVLRSFTPCNGFREWRVHKPYPEDPTTVRFSFGIEVDGTVTWCDLTAVLVDRD